LDSNDSNKLNVKVIELENLGKLETTLTELSQVETIQNAENELFVGNKYSAKFYERPLFGSYLRPIFLIAWDNKNQQLLVNVFGVYNF
jgi:hypothetical protein